MIKIRRKANKENKKANASHFVDFVICVPLKIFDEFSLDRGTRHISVSYMRRCYIYMYNLYNATRNTSKRFFFFFCIKHDFRIITTDR